MRHGTKLTLRDHHLDMNVHTAKFSVRSFEPRHVEAMVARYNAGATYQQLAELIGTNARTVAKVLRSDPAFSPRPVGARKNWGRCA